MTATKASGACLPCRRLKRKCTRDLPICALCVRLHKSCVYSGQRSTSTPSTVGSTGSARRSLRDVETTGTEATAAQACPNTASPSTQVGSASSHFPSSYFLDTELFQPVAVDYLSKRSQFPDCISKDIPPFLKDVNTALELYFTSIHSWLPMLSKRRVLSIIVAGNEPYEASTLALMLAIRLSVHREMISESETWEPACNLYNLVKSCCSALEDMIDVSLRLIQSLILLAVYEFGHGILPAAFLTVGRAARLAQLTGLNDKSHVTALFAAPDTWTFCEEQRRTWWALFIVERIICSGNESLPLMVRRPNTHDLLPVNDQDWDLGKIVTNEPLYTNALSSYAALGPFARLCQSVHLLDKVHDHCRARKHPSANLGEILREAEQLHRTLSVLFSDLKLTFETACAPGSNETTNMEALSICSVARLSLYNQYGCNDSQAPNDAIRLPLETELQKLSLDGIRFLSSTIASDVSVSVIELTRRARDHGRAAAVLSPFLYLFLYHSATEGFWFMKEEGDPYVVSSLERTLEAMTALGFTWNLGATYSTLLAAGGIAVPCDAQSSVLN